MSLLSSGHNLQTTYSNIINTTQTDLKSQRQQRTGGFLCLLVLHFGRTYLQPDEGDTKLLKKEGGSIRPRWADLSIRSVPYMCRKDHSFMVALAVFPHTIRFLILRESDPSQQIKGNVKDRFDTLHPSIRFAS